MSEFGDSPRGDDPIYQLFRRLRDGFSEIVVNLVDRVDRRVQLFIEDERHMAPSTDELVMDAVQDVVSVFSSLMPPTETARPRVASDDDNGDDEDAHDEH